MYDIRIATTPEEREAIFRLRYTIYVEEMKRSQKWADPVNRRIEEPLDAHAVLIGAWDAEGQLVGTVRINYDDFGTYQEFYQLDRARALIDQTCISTKLMVARAVRNNPEIATGMMLACYRHATERGTVFCFVDCNSYLLARFRSYGWRSYCGPTHHAEYGEVEPLVLCLPDQEWLQTVSSPFLPYCKRELYTPRVEEVLYGAIMGGQVQPLARSA